MFRHALDEIFFSFDIRVQSGNIKLPEENLLPTKFKIIIIIVLYAQIDGRIFYYYYCYYDFVYGDVNYLGEGMRFNNSKHIKYTS